MADRGDWARGRELALVVPGADAGVEDRVREREEQLDVEIDAVLLVAVAVPLRDELREQVPVAGRELRSRPVGPVLRDHLLLVRQSCAEREQLLRLGAVLGRAVPG